MNNPIDVVSTLTPEWQLVDGQLLWCKLDVFFVNEYQDFPAAAGVYVISCDCCGPVPLYVGKTWNLRERFRTGHQVTPHLIPHKEVTISLHYIDDSKTRDFIEKQWIVNGKPLYNRETVELSS
jgi:excinuclease UvrABC nuclease subunit